MISFILGAIIGLLLAIITIMIALAYQPPLSRTLKQVASVTKKKGKILEPEDEVITEWLNELPNA